MLMQQQSTLSLDEEEQHLQLDGALGAMVDALTQRKLYASHAADDSSAWPDERVMGARRVVSGGRELRLEGDNLHRGRGRGAAAPAAGAVIVPPPLPFSKKRESSLISEEEMEEGEALAEKEDLRCLAGRAHRPPSRPGVLRGSSEGTPLAPRSTRWRFA
jgi:hypothetical protein